MASRIWVNISSANDLLPDGTKSSTEPILTFCVVRFWAIDLGAISLRVPKLLCCIMSENYTFDSTVSSSWDNHLFDTVSYRYITAMFLVIFSLLTPHPNWNIHHHVTRGPFVLIICYMVTHAHHTYGVQNCFNVKSFIYCNIAFTLSSYPILSAQQ